MITTLLVGGLTILVNMAIQITAIVLVIGYLFRLVDSGRMLPGFFMDLKVMGVVLLVLFAGHVVQFSSWALLFLWLSEFSDFNTAFYHSVVNFTSLGYGDIVMSEKWRLLGGLEAANGILMFGLTASSFLSVMNRLFGRHEIVVQAIQKTRAHSNR